MDDYQVIDEHSSLRLTTLNLQRAVLFVQRVPAEIHHAGSRCGNPGRDGLNITAGHMFHVLTNQVLHTIRSLKQASAHSTAA